MVKNILCDTLNIIGTVCRLDLEECFSDEDIVIMTTSHLKEMKKFLVRIARGKVDEEALEGCEGNDITMTKHKISDTTQLQTQSPTHEPKKIFPMEENDTPTINHVNDKLLNIDRKLDNKEKQT